MHAHSFDGTNATTCAKWQVCVVISKQICYFGSCRCSVAVLSVWCGAARRAHITPQISSRTHHVFHSCAYVCGNIGYCNIACNHNKLVCIQQLRNFSFILLSIVSHLFHISSKYLVCQRCDFAIRCGSEKSGLSKMPKSQFLGPQKTASNFSLHYLTRNCKMNGIYRVNTTVQIA